MADYQLTLEIAEQDLPVILQAGERIIVVRAFSDAPSNVAWIAVTPLSSSNVVSWTDAYAIYASNTVGDITTTVTTPAGVPSGTYFTLSEEGLEGPFTGPDTPEPGAFRAINRLDGKDSITLGMAQVAGTPGALNPINATVVPANQLATWTPVPTVYVWLASGIAAGAAVTVPPVGAPGTRTASSRSTRIDFAQRVRARCRYNFSLGVFVEEPA